MLYNLKSFQRSKIKRAKKFLTIWKKWLNFNNYKNKISLEVNLLEFIKYCFGQNGQINELRNK